MKSYLKNKKKGFTLIELLVVISIIALLSTIVLASVNSARGKSRDSLRRQTLIQLRNALEVYYSANGSYPSTGGSWYSSVADQFDGTNNGNWIPGLAPKYISVLPQDPLGGAGNQSLAQVCANYPRSFYYNSYNGSGYKVVSHCAMENPISSSDTFYDPQRPTWAIQLCSGTDCTD